MKIAEYKNGILTYRKATKEEEKAIKKSLEELNIESEVNE